MASKKGYVWTGGEWVAIGSDFIDSSQFATKTYASTIYPNRNLLHNGAFNVNQRGFSSATSSNHGFDRWRFWQSDGTVTHSAQSFDSGTTLGTTPVYQPKSFARLVTSGQTAAGALSALQQRIENVRTASGETVTLSFWARAGTGTPKVAVEIEQYFGSGGSPSSIVQTYAGQVTLSTTWTRYSVTVALPSVAGKVIGTANDDYVGVNLFTSAGSSLNSRTGSLGIQSATIDFWGVQLEQGSVATPFEHKDYGQELRECQRYYFRLTGQNVYCTGVGASGTAVQGFLYHPVPMRSTPTAYGINALGQDRYYGDGTGASITGTPSVSSYSVLMSSMLFTTSGVTAATPRNIYGQGAGSYLEVSADL